MVLKNAPKYKDMGELKLKMEMNIRMYEPTLVEYLDDLELQVKKSNKIRHAIERQWKQIGDAGELFDPLNKQIEQFGAVSGALIAAIVKRGVLIGSEKSLLLRLVHSIKGAVDHFVNVLRPNSSRS
jgi:hypothetical protein